MDNLRRFLFNIDVICDTYTKSRSTIIMYWLILGQDGRIKITEVVKRKFKYIGSSASSTGSSNKQNRTKPMKVPVARLWSAQSDGPIYNTTC